MNKLKEKVLTHSQITCELNSIYSKKNSDYNDSFGRSFDEYGMTMPCIRLEDKLNRLKALTVHNKEQQVADESVEDTLLDMANYAIMTLIELRMQRKFNLEENRVEVGKMPLLEEAKNISETICGISAAAQKRLYTSTLTSSNTND